MKVTHLILDTAAFISAADLTKYGIDTKFYTTESVLAEVRDSKSRELVAKFPFDLLTKQPSSTAYKAVCDFSRLTGDYAHLSTTDLEVLALAYQIETETNGEKHIKEFKERRPKIVSSEIKEKPAMPIREEPAVVAADTPAEDANESEWVTLESFSRDGDSFTTVPKKKKKTRRKKGARGSNSCVGCITADFSMQNVMLQMGLRLVAVNGLQIRGAKTWISGCFTCWKTTTETEREFCGNCGGHTMVRVTEFTDKNGELQHRWHRNYRFITKRGTKYSIPAPKGGKKSTDVILREDELMMRGKTLRKSKAVLDEWVGSETFGAGAKASQDVRYGFKYGHKQRNPNEKHGNIKCGRKKTSR